MGNAREVYLRRKTFEKTNEIVMEGPSEKMSKSKKNVIEPDEILENYGIDATRFYDISSPPDRELSGQTKESKALNLIRRIDKYFKKTELIQKRYK